MAPFVEVEIDVERLQALRPLRDDDLGAAPVELIDDPVGIEGLVGDQAAELDILDQRRNPDRVVALAREELKADEIAERVRKREDFRRPAAFRLADGLALSPPFAPCPWRWTWTMVASTMAYSRSGASDKASKIRLNTSRSTQ